MHIFMSTLKEHSLRLSTAIYAQEDVPAGKIISDFLQRLRYKVIGHGAFSAVLIDPLNYSKVIKVAVQDEDNWIKYARWCLGTTSKNKCIPKIHWVFDVNGFWCSSINRYYELQENYVNVLEDVPESPRWKELKRLCEVLQKNGMFPSDLAPQNVMQTRSGTLKLIDPIA